MLDGVRGHAERHDAQGNDVGRDEADSPHTSLRRETDSVVGDSAVVAKWTLVSRLSGFLRVATIAAVLGPTFLGNLFQTVNLLPWIVYDLAIGSLLASVLVPELVKADEKGSAEFSRAASSLLVAVTLAFAAITALLMAAAPVMARLLALGLDNDAPRADYIDAAIPLLLLTTIQLLGYGFVAFAVSVQNARGSFALAAAAPAAENVVVIAAMILFGVWRGTGVTISSIQTTGLLILGLGSSLGVLVHVILQFVGVRRVGATFVAPSLRHPSVPAALAKARPASLATVMNALRLFIPLVATAAVPGGTVAFQLALNVLGLPTAVGARSIGTAFLPRASHLAVTQRWAQFRREYLGAQSLLLLFSVPAAAALAALGPWLADGLAVGQMATDAGADLLLASLATVSGAVIGGSVAHLAVATSFARGRPRVAAREMAWRLATTALGVAIAWQFTSGIALLVVIGLTSSVADLVGATVAWRDPLAALDAPAEREPVSPLASRTVVAALITYVPLGLVAWTSGFSVETPLLATAFAGGVGLASVVVYSAIRWRLGPAEISSVLRQLRNPSSPPSPVIT